MRTTVRNTHRKMHIILAALLVLSISSFAVEKEGAIEFGNTICPISGEKIIEDEAVRYEYNGVVYNLCCKMCLKDFKKGPKEYIKKLEALKEKEAHADTHEHHHH